MFVKDVNPKTYCGCKEDSRYFLKENMLSELVTEYQKEQARQNLGIDSSGSIISNIFKRIEKDKDNIIIEYNIIPDKINYSLNSGSPKEIDTIEGTYYKIGITGQSVNDITIETVYTKDNDIKTDISTKKFYGNVLSIDETSSENGVLNIKYTFKDDLGKIDSKQITYNPISNNLLIDGTNAQSNTLDINPTTIDNNLKYQIPVLNRYNRPGKVNIEIESVSSDKPGLITPDDYNTFNEIQSLLTHGDGEIISTGDPFDTEITDSKFTINYNYKNLEGGGESNITIPLVTDTKAGLMSPTQYDNLSLLDNNLLNNLLIGGNDVNLISGELTEGGYKITVPQLRPNDYNPDEQQYEDITIPNVTNSSNGLMLSSDKTKLDSITLDDNNKIDSSMLPSYVDDVIDIAVVANTLPIDNMVNGDLGFNTTDNKFYLYNTNTKWIDVSMTNPVETGKIYIATKDGNKQYRWSGTTMVQITSSNLVIGTVTGTAFDGGKGKAIEDWKNLLSTYSYSVLNIAVPDSNKVTIDYNYTTFGTLSSQLRHLDIPTVTTSLAGVMSASDKAKLDSIEENANNYTLPTASVMDLGGIKAGAEPAYDISEEYIAYTNSIGNACIKLPLIGGKSGDVNVNQGLLSLTDYNTFKSKQDALVSGTNIKTINNQSILGSGNINIESGESSTIYDLTKINALTGSSSSSDVQSAFTPLSGGSSPSVPQVGNILRTNDTGYPFNTVVYAQSTDNGEGIKSFKYLSGATIRAIQVMPDFSAVNVAEFDLNKEIESSDVVRLTVSLEEGQSVNMGVSLEELEEKNPLFITDKEQRLFYVSSISSRSAILIGILFEPYGSNCLTNKVFTLSNNEDGTVTVAERDDTDKIPAIGSDGKIPAALLPEDVLMSDEDKGKLDSITNPIELDLTSIEVMLQIDTIQGQVPDVYSSINSDNYINSRIKLNIDNSDVYINPTSATKMADNSYTFNTVYTNDLTEYKLYGIVINITTNSEVTIVIQHLSVQ